MLLPTGPLELCYSSVVPRLGKELVLVSINTQLPPLSVAGHPAEVELLKREELVEEAHSVQHCSRVSPTGQR